MLRVALSCPEYGDFSADAPEPSGEKEEKVLDEESGREIFVKTLMSVDARGFCLLMGALSRLQRRPGFAESSSAVASIAMTSLEFLSFKLSPSQIASLLGALSRLRCRDSRLIVDLVEKVGIELRSSMKLSV